MVVRLAARWRPSVVVVVALGACAQGYPADPAGAELAIDTALDPNGGVTAGDAGVAQAPKPDAASGGDDVPPAVADAGSPMPLPTDLCTDGTHNGAETDTDCGGPDCGACPLDWMCAEDGDCRQGGCYGGVCALSDPLAPAAGTGGTAGVPAPAPACNPLTCPNNCMLLEGPCCTLQGTCGCALLGLLGC